MWQIIKWIFLIVVIGGGILWISGTKIGGKTVGEYVRPVLESTSFKEGVHDIRALVGEGLKAAGEAISEDVTDSERKQLDNLVKQEMQKGTPIAGAPGQQALPPTPQTVPQAPPPQPRPGAAQMLQQVQQVQAQARASTATQAPAPTTPEAAPTPEQPKMIPAPMPAPSTPAPAPPKGAPQGQGY